MPLLAVSTGFAQRAGMLCCVLFTVMSAQAFAQTSATDNPSPAAEQPSAPATEKPAAAEEKPAAAADDKPAAVEQKPAPAEETPAVAQDKTVDKPLANKPAAATEPPAVPEAKPAVVEEKPDQKPVVSQEPALKQKSTAKREGAVQGRRAEHSKAVKPTSAAKLLKRVAGKGERTMVMLCARFRTYDPSSGTYRGYDGRTHSCR